MKRLLTLLAALVAGLPHHHADWQGDRHRSLAAEEPEMATLGILPANLAPRFGKGGTIAPFGPAA